jgi:hypothetical protein
MSGPSGDQLGRDQSKDSLDDSVVDLILTIVQGGGRHEIARLDREILCILQILFLKAQAVHFRPSWLAIQASPLGCSEHLRMVARDRPSGPNAGIMSAAQDHPACFRIGTMLRAEESPSPQDRQDPFPATHRANDR